MSNEPSAIVTGISSGLGLELAIQLIRMGYRIVGVSRSETKDQRWWTAVKEKVAVWVQGDVSDPCVADSAIIAANTLGRYSLLINNAGQGIFGIADSYSRNDIDTVLAGSLIGLMLFSIKSVENFSQNGGIIINIMSLAAQKGNPNETIYCAAKWGARGYTEALRAELRGKPIKIIGVYPGGIKTPFWNHAAGLKVDSSAFMSAEDVAETILFALKAKPSLQITDVFLNHFL